MSRFLTLLFLAVLFSDCKVKDKKQQTSVVVEEPSVKPSQVNPDECLISATVIDKRTSGQDGQLYGLTVLEVLERGFSFSPNLNAGDTIEALGQLELAVQDSATLIIGWKPQPGGVGKYRIVSLRK